MNENSPARSLETRLGLAMCGGVSLAIYINGVSNEFYRAVRGAGVYGLVKELTDSNIVVDILSGSSAGGLNAILLSAALCNGSDFGITADFWRDRAKLAALLHPPQSHDSVLDGEYHEGQLREALAKLMPEPSAGNGKHDAPPLPELDLFITGTDVNGRRSPEVDAAGQTLQVKDHRILFWLKHRQGRKEPFGLHALEDGRSGEQLERRSRDALAKLNLGALARLGRITSSFPAAFAPIVVDSPAAAAAVAPAGLGSVDGRLTRWGQLNDTTVLIDGGVVDNKPFTSTLEAIFSRLSERPVARYLLFVDPAPDEASASGDPSRQNGHGVRIPGFVHIIEDSLSNLPRYDSIAADLKALHTHNAQLRNREDLLEASASVWAGSADQAGDVGTLQGSVYRKARHTVFVQTCLEAVFEDGPLPALPEDQTPLHAALAALTPEELNGFCQEFDIGLRLRRLFALTYYLVDPRPDQPPGTLQMRLPAAGAFELVDVPAATFSLINRQLDLLSIVRAQMQRALAELNRGGRAAALLQDRPRQFWDELVGALRGLFGRLEQPASFGAAAAPDRLLSAAELDLLAKSASGAAAQAPFSLQASDDFEKRFLEVGERRLYLAYVNFPAQDSVSLPIELASGLREKDVIKTARISPVDGRLGLGRYPGQKLCGTQLANFGGFLKKSWRSNDNLWGRLDGACVLLETLLKPERLGKPAVLAKLRSLPDLSAEVDKLFPTSSARARGRLRTWVTQLTGAEAQQQVALRELRDGLLGDLVMAVHLEILRADLPGVLKDDRDDALDASRARRRQSADRLAEAERLLVDGRGDELARWFLTKYAVPRETIDSEVSLPSKILTIGKLAIATARAVFHNHDDVARAARPPS